MRFVPDIDDLGSETVMHAVCGSTSGTAALVAHTLGGIGMVIPFISIIAQSHVLCVSVDPAIAFVSRDLPLGPPLQSNLKRKLLNKIRISQVARLATCTPD